MTRVVANNRVRTGFGGVIGRRGGAVEVRVCASLKIAADLRVKGGSEITSFQLITPPGEEKII